jgi:hypothetical protein
VYILDFPKETATRIPFCKKFASSSVTEYVNVL